jgi:hypothetical protein
MLTLSQHSLGNTYILSNTESLEVWRLIHHAYIDSNIALPWKSQNHISPDLLLNGYCVSSTLSRCQ